MLASCSPWAIKIILSLTEVRKAIPKAIASNLDNSDVFIKPILRLPNYGICFCSHVTCIVACRKISWIATKTIAKPFIGEWAFACTKTEHEDRAKVRCIWNSGICRGSNNGNALTGSTPWHPIGVRQCWAQSQLLPHGRPWWYGGALRKECDHPLPI